MGSETTRVRSLASSSSRLAQVLPGQPSTYPVIRCHRSWPLHRLKTRNTPTCSCILATHLALSGWRITDKLSLQLLTRPSAQNYQRHSWPAAPEPRDAAPSDAHRRLDPVATLNSNSYFSSSMSVHLRFQFECIFTANTEFFTASRVGALKTVTSPLHPCQTVHLPQ